jgi:MFS family permease
MLGSFLTGYASSVISSTLGQPSWYTTMGLSLDPTSPSYGKTLDIQAAANGLFYGGGVFGTLITAWFSERWGRLMGFKVAAAFHILGSALQTGAVNQAMVSRRTHSL